MPGSFESAEEISWTQASCSSGTEKVASYVGSILVVGEKQLEIQRAAPVENITVLA